jgi:hypothetical protein
MDLEAINRNRSGLVVVRHRSRLINAAPPLARFIRHDGLSGVSHVIPDLPAAFKISDVHRPSSPRVENGVLDNFIQRSWSWGREQVLLPRRLRGTLWALIPVQILWAIWLTKILTEARPCGGPICRVATLGHHPALLLACAVISVTGLVGLIPFTRGLSRSNDRELVGIAAASAAGGIALLGIAALLTGVVIALLLLALFILGFTAT